MTTHLATYFEKLTIINPMNLESSTPLLSSQCGITYWHGSWEITVDDNGAAVPVMQNDTGLLDADSLLKSAAKAFGDRLTVIILSGTDLPMAEGLMEVSNRKGNIFLQEPDSCLFPVRSCSWRPCICINPSSRRKRSRTCWGISSE